MITSFGNGKERRGEVGWIDCGIVDAREGNGIGSSAMTMSKA